MLSKFRAVIPLTTSHRLYAQQRTSPRISPLLSGRSASWITVLLPRRDLDLFDVGTKDTTTVAGTVAPELPPPNGKLHRSQQGYSRRVGSMPVKRNLDRRATALSVAFMCSNDEILPLSC